VNFAQLLSTVFGHGFTETDFCPAYVNGGAKTGHLAAQNPASGGAPSDMARALLR